MTTESNNASNFLRKCIEPHLKYIETVQFGIPWNGSFAKVKSFDEDCITISVPYAGNYLNWQFFFDSHFPSLGPDFIADDENFLINYTNIDVIKKNVPSLCNWNITNEKCLQMVLKELLSCYKRHEINEFKDNAWKLHGEYKKLIENLYQIQEKDVEILLVNLENQYSEARFIIRMNIDVSDIFKKEYEVIDTTAILTVIYSGPGFRQKYTELQLSESLQCFLAYGSAPSLPYFNDYHALDRYVRELKIQIERAIVIKLKHIEKRRKFITQLLHIVNWAVIEFDTENHSSITLLIPQSDLYFLFTIDLSQHLPIVTRQSIYHFDDNLNPKKEIQTWKNWNVHHILKSII